MDAVHFDRLTRTFTHLLTRRRLGAILGGSALGLPLLAEAKKRHKKKKRCPPCKIRKKGKCQRSFPDGTPCPGGACQGGVCQTDPCPGQKRCGEACIPSDQCCTKEDCRGDVGYVCCNGVCTDGKQEAGSTCQHDGDCCSDFCRAASVGRMTCAATCHGKLCSLDSQCCAGAACVSGYCGCRGNAAGCLNDAECCFSACTALANQTQKRCLSYAGGRCETNYDCWSCRAVGYADCTVTTNTTTHDVCRDGICGCPYECCADADCLPAEYCAVDQFGLRGHCQPLIGP